VEAGLADEVLLVAGGGVGLPVGLVDWLPVVEEGDAVDVLDVEAEAAGGGGLCGFPGDVGVAEALKEEARVVGVAAEDPHDDLIVGGGLRARRGGACGGGEERAGAKGKKDAEEVAH